MESSSKDGGEMWVGGGEGRGKNNSSMNEVILYCLLHKLVLPLLQPPIFAMEASIYLSGNKNAIKMSRKKNRFFPYFLFTEHPSLLSLSHTRKSHSTFTNITNRNERVMRRGIRVSYFMRY
jgi:hypothetical protein